MENIVANIILENEFVELHHTNNISVMLKKLLDKGINIPIKDIEDPDNSIISRKIYEKIFSNYNNEVCSGDTLNTFNYTFGSDNWKLNNILHKKSISAKDKNRIIKAANTFKSNYLTIGNFTIFNIGHIYNNTQGMNCERAIKLKDSWPLTLLCIQDYLERYSRLKKNPLHNTFEKNESTINYFKKYKIRDGFVKYCDDHYFSPKYYKNNIEYSYLDENFDVKLDLFDGLNFNKPLAESIYEMEQYIERATNKIFARGEIIISQYNAKI